MPPLNASEDFARRTLSAIRGLLPRLAYVTRLRDKSGTYHHWGLARTYGADAASEAMLQAHKELVTAILRTPLAKLMAELDAPGEDAAFL